MAVVLSGLCLLHCLALPLLVGLLPFIARMRDQHFHLQMLAIVVPVSVIAFALGYRRHDAAAVPLAGFAGLALLVVAATVAHNELGVAADRVFTICGALVLAAAHFYNTRLSRQCA